MTFAIGTVLEVKTRDHGTKNFVVEGFREDMYMRMRCQSDSKMTMTLHPEHVARIKANGGEDGIKVLNCQNLQDVVVRATNVIVPVAPVEVVKTASAKSEGPSKKERAAAIRATNPTATRKELIAMFMEQLNMTHAGASTYSSYR